MASAGKRIRRGAETAGFRLLTATVRGLPRPRALALGGGVGRFAFDRGLRREVAVRNVLERLQPSSTEEAVAIARESYRVMGRTFVDLMRADLTSDEDVWSGLDRDEFAPLLAVHAQGSGGVFVSGHFGNWELAVLAIRRSGVPVAAMAGDQANPAVDRAVRELRRRAGVEPLSARTGLRDALGILKGGGFVATLMDQDARSKGVFADFLGAPASTHVGPASLAARAGVPLVPGVLADRGDRYELRLGPVVRFPEKGTDAELRHAAVTYNRFLEAEVRRAPGNYFWAHRRWKTKPPAPSAGEGPAAAAGEGGEAAAGGGAPSGEARERGR